MGMTLKNITASYEGKIVLNNLSLDIPDGKLASILGVSGAGKTTILRVIAGLMKPDSGSVFMNGKDITNLPAEKRNIGYVFQSPLLFPHMTVTQNIRFGLETRKWPEDRMRTRVQLLLNVLSLEGLEDRLPEKLSGGQQQRVAIARALAPEPGILLMDEPFSSLDPQLRKSSGDLIQSIQKAMGITIVFVTHDREESLSLSDQITLIGEGRSIQSDSPLIIYNKPVNKEVAAYMGECNFLRGEVRSGVFSSPFCTVDAAGCENGSYELLVRPHRIRIASYEMNPGHSADIDSIYRVKSINTVGKKQEIRLIPTHSINSAKHGNFVPNDSDGETDGETDEKTDGGTVGGTDGGTEDVAYASGHLLVETYTNTRLNEDDLVTASLFPDTGDALCFFRL